MRAVVCQADDVVTFRLKKLCMRPPALAGRLRRKTGMPAQIRFCVSTGMLIKTLFGECIAVC
jgi:hypothetical protein